MRLLQTHLEQHRSDSSHPADTFHRNASAGNPAHRRPCTRRESRAANRPTPANASSSAPPPFHPTDLCPPPIRWGIRPIHRRLRSDPVHPALHLIRPPVVQLPARHGVITRLGKAPRERIRTRLEVIAKILAPDVQRIFTRRQTLPPGDANRRRCVSIVENDRLLREGIEIRGPTPGSP